jgi:hypothetical protein
MSRLFHALTLTCTLAVAACASGRESGETESTTSPPTEDGDETGGVATAAVEAVEASGDAGAYTFAVTVRSPDTGCDRYADWWEVATPEGELVYRRILAHSHVDEQPFTRSGGPVEVDADTELVVRAHMSPGGYGDQVMRGSVNAGFESTELPGFAPELEQAQPLPDGCAF